MPCSSAGSLFRDGPMATRKCNESGEWEEADLTSCTLVELNVPFLLTWFVLDTDMYTDAMEETFVRSVSHHLSQLDSFHGYSYTTYSILQMEGVLEENGVAYYSVSLQSAYVSSSSVSATFRVDLEEEENQTEHVIALNSFLRNTEAFSIFSNYRVIESGRGLLNVTSAGIANQYTCRTQVYHDMPVNNHDVVMTERGLYSFTQCK